MTKKLKLEFNTSPIRTQIVAALAEADVGLSMAELSIRLAVTRGALTKPVRCLEAEGLLVVDPDPRDRRYRFLVITDAGSEWLLQLSLRKREWIATAFSEVSIEQLQQLFQLLGIIRIDDPFLPVKASGAASSMLDQPRA